MRRLKDLDTPASPIEADAADLLRAAAGYQPPAGQKQRVRARLLQVRVTRRRAVSRPAVAAAVILCAAAASAAVGRHWIVQTLQVLTTDSQDSRNSGTKVRAPRSDHSFDTRVGAPDRLPQDDIDRELDRDLSKVGSKIGSKIAGKTRGKSRQAYGSGRKLAVAGTTAVETGAHPTTSSRRFPPGHPGDQPPVGPTGLNLEPAPNPGAAPTTATRLATAGAAASAAGYAAGRAATRAPDHEAPPTSDRLNATGVASREETGLVFDAMRALRQEKRPARASRLLDEYLRRHPDGALREEALALSVEAAGMRGDPRTEDLIRRYLDRYPAGHFRAAVELTRARLARP